MLNILTLDKIPNLKHEKIIKQFLIRFFFTCAYHTGEISSFDPLVLAEIEKDSNWLESTAGEMQSTIIQSLTGNENFLNDNQIEMELGVLINLYCNLSKKQDLTQNEYTLMAHLFDKFTLLLLSSDSFMSAMYQMGVITDGD